MTQEEQTLYHQAQLDEIYRFKWILGTQMHRDPLTVYTIDEIAMMWIERYAAGFRENWERTHGSGCIDNGINN